MTWPQDVHICVFSYGQLPKGLTMAPLKKATAESIDQESHGGSRKILIASGTWEQRTGNSQTQP